MLIWGESDIEPMIVKLTEHGMVKLSEHRNVTPDISREILRTAL